MMLMMEKMRQGKRRGAPLLLSIYFWKSQSLTYVDGCMNLLGSIAEMHASGC